MIVEENSKVVYLTENDLSTRFIEEIEEELFKPESVNFTNFPYLGADVYNKAHLVIFSYNGNYKVLKARY